MLVLEVKKTGAKSSDGTMTEAKEQCKMYLAGLEREREQKKQINGLPLTGDTRVIGFVVLAKQDAEGKMNFEVERVEPGDESASA